jgi:hypothetical protein
MLIVFFLILLIGLAGFAFVFTKALKSRAMPEPVLLRPFDKLPHPVPVEPMPVTDGSDQIVQLKALCVADEQKIVKLEQMIDEKNGMIEDLKKGFQSGDDHQAQVDSLKQILQAQIEELKQQNKQLKSEVARLSEENIDLQTKVYAGQVPVQPVVERIVIHPAASVDMSGTAPEPVVEDNKGHAENIQMNSLSLHDVFGGEEEKNS